MTGESQHDDNDDFLDDDFVIEDIAPKNEDLDRLFEASPDGAKKAPVNPANPDEEDVLFAEPELGFEPSTTFQGREQFAEESAAEWEGEALDLEAEAASMGEPTEAMAAAEETFTKELDSLLQSDEDFALDSEQELEVIGDGSAAAGDGISEFEQSGPFVLDDGEGMWQDEQEQSTADESTSEEFGVPLHAASADESHEPGWEPLPSKNMDELSEVDEIERAEDGELLDEADPVYGDQFADEAEVAHAPALALVGAPAEADAESHEELYVQEDDGNEVVGARERSGRGFRVLLSLAAMLTVVGGAAVVVLRPQWVGLRLQPERVQQAEVSRPKIAIEVSEPKLTGEQPAEPTPPKVAVEEPAPVEPTNPVEPPKVAVEVPAPVDPPQVDVEPQPEPSPPKVAVEAPVPVEPQPPVEPSNPVAVEPVEPSAPLAVVTAPTPELPGWPAPQAVSDAPRGAEGEPRERPSRLVRVSEELAIGEPDDSGNRPRSAQGLVPGSRAFAQLQNGNYFIGNVKAADSTRITLRVDNGEVTIPVAAIARVTELGSADYEDLQKATSGFVRLTNNNRLVGGILSGIADDHIVLEFRKNRVMLPKSLIGEIVKGEDDAGIRLDTTREEDDWLRHLVERQLGTGVGAEPPTPPQGSQSPR